LREVQELLDGAGLTRLVVFFDDFSEIGWTDQRLFVDVVLAPLNNASNERIKLKIAGYPGRVYYGKIDPGKVDTLSLDFASIYHAQDIQTAEAAAVEYTGRLLQKRFEAFGLAQEDYFDPALPIGEYHTLIFQTTANVPRLIGFLLHQCYLDRVAKKQRITAASIRLASEKYFTHVVSQYFDQMSRFALEPFARKIDRHNQKKLLEAIVAEAKEVRKKIRAREVGGTYFDKLPNPGVSHFTVSPQLEKVLASLEFNFLLTKYSDMRDKDAKDVSVFALFYGLCEAERLPWGYPKGREYRNYFVQRVFDFNHVIHQFLSKTKTIRCDECGACFPIDRRESFELFHWKCPECNRGTCEIVNVSDDFQPEVMAADKALMLEPVELSILNVLHDEQRPMRAGEISQLLDVTHQLVGRRTAKLAERGLLIKKQINDAMRSTLTSKADRYFSLAPK
jgi:hypothetical protein